MIVDAGSSNGYLPEKAVVLPVQGGAAYRTKMVGYRVAAFGGPHPLRRFGCHLVEAKARLIADHGTPVRRWHAKQWHNDMRDGSPAERNRPLVQ